MQFKLWLENEIIPVPLQDFLVSRRSLFAAFQDIKRGKISKTKKAVDIWLTKDNEYQLVDGYHRYFEAVLLDKRDLLAEIIGRGYTDYWAEVKPSDRFKYSPSLEFRGLEDLADVEVLEEIKTVVQSTYPGVVE